MPRISLDVTEEQRRQLKTLSSYASLSMREFILSRVFVEAAETVFTPRQQAKVKDDDLQKIQETIFDKSEIIILSSEKWAALKRRIKADEKTRRQ